MRCPVLLLLVTRVAWVCSGNIHVGAAQSPTAPDDGSARQDPGAPGLVQTNSPRKVPGHPDHDSNSSPCPDPCAPPDPNSSPCPDPCAPPDPDSSPCLDPCAPPDPDSSPCLDPCPAQAAPSILDIFPQDLLTSRCSESFSTLNQTSPLCSF